MCTTPGLGSRCKLTLRPPSPVGIMHGCLGQVAGTLHLRTLLCALVICKMYQLSAVCYIEFS